MAERQGPLSRFRVLDLTRVRAGPTCVRQLADWGADVVKVEAPEGDGGMGGAREAGDFQNLHRNKRSVALDLKSPEGLDVLRRLVAGADVLVENFRPDVKDRLGIGVDAMRALNPRLVYASISGFGQDGPYARRPGFDQVAQGLGGLMSITGLPGQGPVRVGIPIADLTAGLFCAQGILIALLEREHSGQGQWVQSDLLSAQIAMLDFQAARFLVDGEVAGQAGNNHPTIIPTGVFATSDGHINIAAAGDPIYRRTCEALGVPALADDPRFVTQDARSRNRDALNAALEAVTRQRPSAAWVERLNDAGVPCGPINAIDAVFADPQVRHLGVATAVGDTGVRLVGQAVALDRTPSALRTLAPGLGEHTDEILAELGMDAATIASLRQKGAVH
ncbi:MAG: CaiB/BaiF CoA transferase family protein [Janthinobacterium lividum]